MALMRAISQRSSLLPRLRTGIAVPLVRRLVEHLRRETGGHGIGLGGGSVKMAGERFEPLHLFGEGGLKSERWSDQRQLSKPFGAKIVIRCGPPCSEHRRRTFFPIFGASPDKVRISISSNK
jgi:hypothetical protein